MLCVPLREVAVLFKGQKDFNIHSDHFKLEVFDLSSLWLPL